MFIRLKPARAARALVATLTLALATSTAHAQTSSEGAWVASWSASPVDLNYAAFAGTIRNTVFTSAGGDAVRVRFTNLFGNLPLVIDSAYVGVSDAGGTVPGANVPLTFAGAPLVSIPQGAEIWSDPVDLQVPARSNLSVSFHIPTPVEQTGHYFAQATTHYVTGAPVSPLAAPMGWMTNNQWFFMNAVDVRSTRQTKTIVAFGDSITDGYRSTIDANRRWPDALSRRLGQQEATASVVNAGISGNRVLTGQGAAGQSALARFDRDVLRQAGAKAVVLLEGVNDILADDAKPDALIEAYKQLIWRAHDKGLKIYGGTILPFGGDSSWTRERETTRQKVNKWIRTARAFDGVIDFAAAVASPSNPEALHAPYDSGDRVHPSDAGYQAMADAINLPALCKDIGGC